MEMICPKCGTTIPDGALFCGRCGAPIEYANVNGYNDRGMSSTDDLSNQQFPAASGGNAGEKKVATGLVITLWAALAAAAFLIIYFCVLKPVQTPTEIKADEFNVTLNVGQTKRVTLTFEPEKNVDKSVDWESDNKSIATVSDGKITAVASGTCKITVASKKDASVAAVIKVKVRGGKSDDATSPSPSDSQNDNDSAFTEQMATQLDNHLPSVSPEDVYPNVPLTDADLSGLDVYQLQHYVNMIFAKNGYEFQFQDAANFFSCFPWYSAYSDDQNVISSRMSSVDTQNIKLLLQYRSTKNFDPHSVTGIDSLWTFEKVQGALSESFVSSLSTYDLYLLGDTILAKNGYEFSSSELSSIFGIQKDYSPRSSDIAQLSFSDTDIANLKLLAKYMGSR